LLSTNAPSQRQVQYEAEESQQIQYPRVQMQDFKR